MTYTLTSIEYLILDSMKISHTFIRVLIISFTDLLTRILVLHGIHARDFHVLALLGGINSFLSNPIGKVLATVGIYQVITI